MDNVYYLIIKTNKVFIDKNFINMDLILILESNIIDYHQLNKN
jgi:hypothetical protein